MSCGFFEMQSANRYTSCGDSCARGRDVHAERARILYWLFPLFFFQAYLGLSILLFFQGPWPWPVERPEALLVFLLAAQLCIALGYLAAALVPAPKTAGLSEQRLRRYFDICLTITLLLAIPTSLTRTGSVLPNLHHGITSPGQAYLDNYFRLLEYNPYVWAEYLRILLALPLASLFPLLVYLWGNLGRVQRLLGVFAVFFHLCLYLATGTNKGVADIIITLPFLLLLANWSGGIRLRLLRPRYVLAFLLAFSLFLSFFSAGQLQRAGKVGENGFLPGGKVLVQADRRNGAYAQLLPAPVVITYESLTRYLGQGYFAFSMAMNLDTPSTYGFGNSMFLSRNADALLGGRYFSENALPYVLEQRTGWSMMMLWHSLYTWLASDFGLYGTLLLMAFFGFLLALAWRRALDRQAVVWVTLLHMLLILFYYIPANNQLFQVGETTSAFVQALLWLALSGERVFYRKPC